jgi:hypothetical protein
MDKEGREGVKLGAANFDWRNEVRYLLKSLLAWCGFSAIRLKKKEKELFIKMPDFSARSIIAANVLELPGQISFDEAHFLGHKVASLTQNGPIVEIGTLFGWSTKILALFKDPATALITVDNFTWNPFGISPEMHRKLVERTLADVLEKYNTTIWRGSSDSFFLKSVGLNPSLVFIDGDHCYEQVKKDINGAVGIGAKLICGHDYDNRICPGVVKAVDERGGPRELCGSIWVL